MATARILGRTLSRAPLPAPSAPGFSNSGSGGTVAAGTYGAKATLVNAAGESVASAASSTTTSGSTSTLTVASPAPSGNATGWYGFVTQAGGSTYTRQQTLGSPTPIGATLVLTAPPSSGGDQAPSTDTSSPFYQFVPAACTASTTSSSTVTGGVTTAITVASTSGMAVGQGLIIDSGGATPESATIYSIVGNVVTFGTQVNGPTALEFTHAGTYNVIGAPCAVFYTAPSSGAPTPPQIESLDTDIHLSASAAATFTLYVLPSGFLTSDAGNATAVYSKTFASAGVSFDNDKVFLQAGDQLAWAASVAATIAAQVDGLEGVGTGATTTSSSF